MATSKLLYVAVRESKWRRWSWWLRAFLVCAATGAVGGSVARSQCSYGCYTCNSVGDYDGFTYTYYNYQNAVAFDMMACGPLGGNPISGQNNFIRLCRQGSFVCAANAGDDFVQAGVQDSTCNKWWQSYEPTQCGPGGGS